MIHSILLRSQDTEPDFSMEAKGLVRVLQIRCWVVLQQICKDQSFFFLSIENVEDFLLTRNPPLGFVTSVLPMVMFSFTSRKLGMVVFSKKKKKKNKLDE